MSYLRNIDRALVHLNHARTEINKACEEISGVRGLTVMWAELGKLANRIEARQGGLRRELRSERIAKLNAEPTENAR